MKTRAKLAPLVLLAWITSSAGIACAEASSEPDVGLEGAGTKEAALLDPVLRAGCSDD